ncbi:MAG: hypothetical protein GVY08_12155 [Bacteroidetes bacterium]|jgi:hypothetical protein|nr:hypothetical protein [Bacteroidota bacterium]
MNIYQFNTPTLRKWLNYDLSATVLFFISFLFIASLYVLAGFIILFLPLLIGTLIKEERYGWLVSLCIFIFMPAIVIYIYFRSTTWYFILQFVPAAFFLFYCYLLKHTIDRWKDPIVEPEPDLNL